MRTRRRPMIELYGLAFLIGAVGIAWAQDAKPTFPVMAPIEQYREASASAEIALAQTAAPTSISGDASVLVLGNHEYETAVKGKNGFVCLVWRSWAATLDDPDFWNPKFRAPICFNPAGAHTVLPAYLERTKWALAGASKAEIEDRIRAELASNRIATPDPGALAYMTSKEGDTGSGHHFPPHVMVFLAHTEGADWGAGLHGSPIIVEQQHPEPFTVFDILVPLYSDGTPKTFAAAQEPDLNKEQMKVTKVAGNVYKLVGPIPVGDDGNIAACFGEDGIVLVDVETAALAPKIQAALKSIADQPVRFVILTHYHGDHAGGSAYFQKSAPVIAQENVRKRMENGGSIWDGTTHHPVKPKPREALPIITFDHDMTLHLNGEDIRLMHFPTAHTDGDSIVFFPKSNVVSMGDLFVTYGFPFVDVDSGGSIDGMIDAVEKVIAQMPADVKVIPGHGPVSSLDDMRAFVKMMKETRTAVQSALDRGQTLDQMKQAKLLDPWKQYSGPLSEDDFLAILYTSLISQKTGEFIKHN